MSEDGAAGGGTGGHVGGGEGRRRRRRPRRRQRGGRGPGGPNGPNGPNAPGGPGAPFDATASPNGNDNGSASGPIPWSEIDPDGFESGGSAEFDAPASAESSDFGDAADASPREGERRNENSGGGGGASLAQRGEAERRPDWQNRGRNNRNQRGRGRGHGRPQRNNNHRSRRGRMAENWWARRWVEVLERFAVGRRLGRGRNYARQGHIVDIEIGKGYVTAHVQGSRDAPYLVRMHFSMLSSTDWKKLTRALAQRPDIAVELGMGQIPESIEQVFEEQRLSLFPNASGDLKAACSCPDNANPCKHVAAVYYLLGEEFDRDPFLIFQLRGMERSELLAALGPAAIPRPPSPPPPIERAYGPDGEPVDGEEGELLAPPPIPVIEPPPERVIPDEPLPQDAEVFWGGAVRSRDEAIEVRIPRKPGAIVARLGGFPFWRGQSNCEAAMARTYRNASITGLDVYLGAGAVNEDEDS
jgi:uncharacterized Zn finger protein